MADQTLGSILEFVALSAGSFHTAPRMQVIARKIPVRFGKARFTLRYR